MQEFIKLLKEKKNVVIIILLALIAFVSVSIILYNVNHPSGDISAEVESEETNSGVKLTNEQKQIQSNYSNDVKEIVALLKATIWTNDEGTYNVRFDDSSITINNSSTEQQTVIPYVVSALSEEESSNSESFITTTSIVLLTSDTDETNYILTLTKTQTGEYGIDYSLSSSLFSDMTLSRGVYQTDFTVSDLTSDFSDFVDGHVTEMEDQLKDFCYNFYPAATSATWTKTMTIDWNTNTITTEFGLNNYSNTTVTMTYDRAAQIWSIS